MTRAGLFRCAAFVTLLGITTQALAHDTWFERLPAKPGSDVMLALGTGNRFPTYDFPLAAASLQRSGCRSGATPVPLRAVRETPKGLLLRTQPSPPGAALSCWAQQQPFEVEITPEIVQVYFREIQPPQAVRDAWAEMQARGVKWKERFTKHARIELRGTRAQPLNSPATATPTDMGMDALLESGLGTLHPNDALVFQVLRDGTPLPDFSVQLRSDLGPIGFWKKTDAQGRVSFTPPLAGRWVLRGTDLRLSDTVPDTWESRFVTLAFEVVPPDAQPRVPSR